MADYPWKEAIQRACDGEAKATLFVESRQDLAIEASSSEGPAVTLGFWAGAGAQGPNSPWTYLSDAQPEDLGHLVNGAPPPRLGSGRATNVAPCHPIASDPGLAELKGALVIAQRLCPKGQFNTLWVESDQRVWVGCEELTASDRRQARRFRLDGYLSEGGRSARATTERALAPHERLDGIVVIDLIDRLRARLDAVDPPRGPTRVVFAPSVAGILVHELVGHAAEADRMLRGESWLSSGAELLAPQLTVIDDPRRGRAPWSIDDEAVDARATAIIRNGCLNNLLHNRRSADGLHTEPNGFGRRASFREETLPRMGCTFIANGVLDPNEIIDGVDDGIYIRRMESAHTDPATGRAVFRVTDSDRIRCGKLERAMKTHLLETVATKALAGIESIGNDLAFDHCLGSCHRDGQTLATSVGAPTICIGLMTVRF